jgi:hypothetical protein
MTSDEYATLMDFLATRFARIDARFDSIEARVGALDVRLTRSEVLWESMRNDLRRVAEGVVAVNERLDRFRAETQVQFDRWTVDFGTVTMARGSRRSNTGGAGGT